MSKHPKRLKELKLKDHENQRTQRRKKTSWPPLFERNGAATDDSAAAPKFASETAKSSFVFSVVLSRAVFLRGSLLCPKGAN